MILSHKNMRNSPLFKIAMAESRLGKLKRPTARKKKITPYVPKFNKDMEYQNYIHSEKWLYKREKYWLEREHACGVCKKELVLGTAQLHHRTYKRLGREESNDLVFLCDGCHTAIHFYPDGRKKSNDPVSLAREERCLREKCSLVTH